MASHKDRLLTHISTTQAQNTGIAAAEHTADDISQDACTHLGLLERTKDSEQLVIHLHSEEVHSVQRKNQSRTGMQTDCLGLRYCKQSLEKAECN